MQLTVFADGISRIRPLLIFRRQGLRTKNSEKEQWDQRVTIQFQKNAWCDEAVMVTWIQNDWCSYFSNPPTPGSDSKLPIADIYRGQQTPKIKKPSKAYQRLSEKHMEESLEDYVGGKISASERRILMTI